mmetsp:Transcript_23339/g.62283  ORF Transcript_23339/g.62283 Transcript_23339/m.62283 type:complete len:222 (-) Transcript_23339:190-855(-)
MGGQARRDSRGLDRVFQERLEQDVGQPVSAEPHPERLPRRAEVPAPGAAHPVPRARAAGHRQHGQPRGRGVADAPQLRAGRGRRQPRPRGREWLPRLRWIPQGPGWHGRLRALRGDLPRLAPPRGDHPGQPRRTAAAAARAAAPGPGRRHAPRAGRGADGVLPPRRRARVRGRQAGGLGPSCRPRPPHRTAAACSPRGRPAQGRSRGNRRDGPGCGRKGCE